MEVEGGQTPFVIVHWNVFNPTARFTTDDVGELGVCTIEPPVNTDQVPFPTIGVFPAKTVPVAQIVVVNPAFAAVGKSWRTTAKVAVDGGQTPFEMVHWKIFVPTPKPVTVVLTEVGDVIEPAPETNDQIPAPTEGRLPLIVVVVAQIV